MNTNIGLKAKIGFVIASLLAVGDIASPFMPAPEDATNGPPVAVLIAGAILGFITLAAAVYSWRTGNRLGARIVAGSRILSMIGALPAFFVDGVPAPIVALVGLSVVLTILAVVLVLSRPAPLPA